MATNQPSRWVRNLNGAKEPLVILGLFQAGATQAIKAGELLELTGAGSTWVPLDSDFDMSAGVIAIANQEIKAGDLAGYYEIIVPRPDDVFSYDLAAAGNSAIGTALYFSSSEAVTVTAGTNILGHIAGVSNYPKQLPAEHGGGDAGTTIRTVSVAEMTIVRANSFLSTFSLLS